MRVLIFGGNGRVAKAMTSLMLARSWKVTSVIRSPSQKKSIQSLGDNQKGTIDVIMHDLKDLKDSDDVRQRILDKCRPDCVVFAAGSFSDVYGIDRDAAKIIIKAATSHPTVRKFLLISFPASRRKPAPWWDSRDVKDYTSEKNSYPDIADAKLQSDEYLVAMSRKRKLQDSSGFQAISLRPSWLLTSPGTGRVHLGKTRALGQIPIQDVAAVAVGLLSREDTHGWYDLVQGNDRIDEAIDKAVRDGINSIDGENVEEMYKVAD
ncbi:hypothetical protein ASPBRDRAFT_199375 [Aspergillus brasiliensis CBS 101740]|uniref:NAD(P)-binding domain-containing protein n=1 Tax=Aspergillus brasiliensis (strain CBS 101740 / IMI 381727 / IBT 21946) TaxID=767769 RepID=A0A1L9U9K7_ASPBC|nr:hypothetical protein ASPBRDRAFT_199375 [Aspergillus brasiliensis CBS 101740]